MRISINLLIIFSLLLSGCGSGEGKVEYKKTYHRNRKVHEVIPYVNGNIHGLKLEYYEDGALRKESPYDSGYVHGSVKFYYPDGKLFSETPRVKGKIHGAVKKYHKNGTLQSETPYYSNRVQPGLKEYNQRGILLDTPHLTFSTRQEKRSNDLIVMLDIKLSSGLKSVKYSQAVPTDDGGMHFIPLPSEDGVGLLTTIITRGSSIDRILMFRAEFVTPYRNRCVVEEAFHLVASY